MQKYENMLYCQTNKNVYLCKLANNKNINTMSKNYNQKKLTLLVSLFICLSSMLNAQWVSPGDGTTYTFPDLVNVTDGVVTNGPDGFIINADLTISANDVLKIDDHVLRVDIDAVLITINGSMICTNANRVRFYGQNETQHFSMRFENATNCNLHNMYFSDGAGIKVIESDVTFDDVKFVYFTTEYCHSVIDILNCNPTIENCYFLLNEGAAIGSPANGQSSPKILNCEFDSNVDGANLPQINLGPGAEDTIYIVGNLVDGTYASFHTGGISVADLMNTGETKILLKDNIIKNNRYGYNQQGYCLSSTIIGNKFLDNHHEDNPMNGGSGISIYGMDGNNKAIIRNNVITGNLWGITAIYFHDINLGTEDDWGNNEIHDNGNSGVVYDLYNNSTCNIMAVGNDWGTTSEQEVEDHIVHQNDDASLGLVTFVPFIDYDAVNETHLSSFDVLPNPVSNGVFRLVLNDNTPSELVVYNLNGQIVKSQYLENKVNTIDVSLLKSGVYFVEVKSAEKTMLKKIIVE